VRSIITDKYLTMLLNNLLAALACASFALYNGQLLKKDFEASGSAGVGNPIGKIVNRESKVRRKPGHTYIWSNVIQGEQVYQQDSIQTGTGSTVAITLEDGTSLELGENSLIVITDAANLNLSNLRGSLILRDKTGKNKKIKVDATGKQTIQEIPVRLDRPESFARFYKKSGALRSVEFIWENLTQSVSGPLKLQFATTKNFVPRTTKTIRLDSGSTSRKVKFKSGEYYWRVVGKDASLADSRKFKVLEVKPVRLAFPTQKQRIEIVDDKGSVQFRWVNRNEIEIQSKDTIELSTDRSFEQMVQTRSVEATVGTAIIDSVAEGIYFWRIKSVFDELILMSRAESFLVEKARNFSLELDIPEEDELMEFRPSMRFQWSVETLEKLTYDLEIKSLNFPKQKIVNEKLLRTSYVWSETQKGNFRWRVRGLWRNREVANSGWRNFKIFEGRQMALQTPKQDMVFHYWTEPTEFDFEWKDDKMADEKEFSYLFEAAKNKSFSLNKKVLTLNDNEIKSSEIQLENGRWYWRVSVQDNQKRIVKRSEVRKFVYGNYPLLAGPKLKSPPSKQVYDLMTSKEMPTLKWEEVKDAKAYDLAIFRITLDGMSPVIQKRLEKTEFEVAEIPSAEYLWKVQAVDPLDRKGIISESRFFKITQGNLLEAPQLASNEMDPSEIEWDRIGKAKRYELYLYRDSNRVKAVKTEDNEWKAPETAGHYTYKIRGVDEFDRPGSWSEERHLVISPDSPRGVSPKDGFELETIQRKSEIKLEWKGDRVIDQYSLEVMDSDSRSIVNKVIQGRSFRLQDLEEGTYRWRITPRLVASRRIASDMNTRSWKLEGSDWNEFEIKKILLDAPDDLSPDKTVKAEDRNILLSWNRVEGAKAYKVELMKGADNLPRSQREFVTRESQITIPMLPEGKVEWQVRAVASLDNGIPAELSAPAESSFEIEKSNIFYESTAGHGYLAFSTIFAPYSLRMVNPTAGFNGSLASTSLTVRVSGEVSLGKNFGLSAGIDSTMYSISGQTFNRMEFETETKYRIELGGGAKRPWIFQPKLGFGLRQYGEFSPSGSSVQQDLKPMAGGAKLGFDFRKQFTDRLSLGIKFSYFKPLFLSGANGSSITSDASNRNYSLGAQGVYWLSKQWGLAAGLFTEKRSISYKTDAASSAQQVFIDGTYFFGSVIWSF